MKKWYKSTEKRPPFFESVWGLFKGKHVELCTLALTEKEYEDYFRYTESSWYSLESEKTGSVTYWMPLKRPKFDINNISRKRGINLDLAKKMSEILRTTRRTKTSVAKEFGISRGSLYNYVNMVKKNEK